MEKAEILRQYIESLPEFNIQQDAGVAYDHMGALIVDAGLQAGIKYETVVLPRVEHILTTYPDEKTTSAFQRIVMIEGARHLLNWQVDRKINTIVDVTRFFLSENVETVEDLRQWLQETDNIQRLRQIKGIGDKTIDYFRILAGISTSAIDRHLFAFLAQAGIVVSGYHEAQQVIGETAVLMEVSERTLDYSIWSYMAG